MRWMVLEIVEERVEEGRVVEGSCWEVELRVVLVAVIAQAWQVASVDLLREPDLVLPDGYQILREEEAIN